MAGGLCVCGALGDSLSGGEVCFVEGGNLFAVDVAGRSVRLLGCFAPDAPTVTRDAQGRYWAKSGANTLAAPDAGTGKLVATVPLRYRPFNHILGPGGRAYVTHHTATADGFTVSVVDLERGELLREIGGVQGLRTDIIADDNAVFLAALSVAEADYLSSRVYRLDPRTDAAEELYYNSDTRYYLRLAAHAGWLYVCHLPRKDHTLRPFIRVLDLAAGEPGGDIGVTELLGAYPRLRRLVFDGRRGIIVAQDGQGRNAVVVTDPELTRVVEVQPVPGTVGRLLSVSNGEIVYLDNLERDSGRRIWLRFYSLGKREEVKSIDISRLPDRT